MNIRTLKLPAFAALLALVVLTQPRIAQAQEAAAAAASAAASVASTTSVVRVDLSAGPSAQTLTLPRGRSAIVELPVDARDVLVTNPAVADAVLRSPRRIYVLGMAAGATDAVFFDVAGRRILSLNIRVDQDVSALSDTIGRLIPGARVHVESLNDSVILTGLVANSTDSDRAAQIARATVARPEQVLNMLTIAGRDQVMLRVRIIEIQRNSVKQLGFNLQGLLDAAGNATAYFGTTATYGINGAVLGGVTGALRSGGASSTPTCGALTPPIGSTTAQCGSIQAFERVGLVRTLAEPNLTAVSGQSAHFLAGGEFPVPVGQDTNGNVTISFKPFGIGLGFTPVVLSGGRISLQVSTEVSETSNENAFSLGGTQGQPTLVVPSLTVRRAETTVELPSGGAMMIAGLLQERTRQNLDSLPGLMNLPVLGALFRSRDYQSGQTELVIIVTPYLVSSTSPQNLQTPADGLQIANDAETILLGRLNRAYNRAPQATAGRSYQGPVGYVVE